MKKSVIGVKKAQSNVVSTVLIILLVVAAVAIVGAIILNVTNKSSTTISGAALCNDIVLTPTSCVYNNTNTYGTFSININGDISLLNVTLTFYNRLGDTAIRFIPGSGLTNLQTNSFLFTKDNSVNPSSRISIYGVIQGSGGTTAICQQSVIIPCSSISNNYVIGAGSPGVGEIGGASTATYSDGGNSQISDLSPNSNSASTMGTICEATSGHKCWYVDSSLPSSGTHDGTSWATAWTGVGSIKSVSGGDFVYISGGPTGSSQTYSTSSWKPTGGSAGNPITYKIGQDLSHDGNVFFNGSGIWLTGSSYETISGDAGDGQMHFILNNGYSQAANTGSTTGLRISYINFSSYLGDGIDGQGVMQFELDHIWARINGTVDHFMSSGIHDPGFDGSKIHDNTIYVPKESNSANGADVFQITGSGFSLYNNLVSGYLINWTGAVVQHQDGIQTLAGSFIKIYNNNFQNLANSMVFMDGYQGAFTNIYIYNNVLQVTSAADNNGPGGIEVGADGQPKIAPNFTNIAVNNNVIANLYPYNGDGMAIGNCPTCNNGSSSPYINVSAYNNILINSGGFTIYHSPIIIGNNSILTTAQGQNDFVQYSSAPNPNNDYHLKFNVSGIVRNGTNVYSYFTIDKDGNPRPTIGNWDIGPYQYGNVTILTPINAMCGGDAGLCANGTSYNLTYTYSSGDQFNPNGTITSAHWQCLGVNGGATMSCGRFYAIFV